MKNLIWIPLLLCTTLYYGCINDCSFGACNDYETCVEGNCIGPCDSAECVNGTCQLNTGECICQAWWEGEKCDIAVNEKFNGAYLRESSDCGNIPAYYIGISPIPGTPQRVSIIGLYNTFDTLQGSWTPVPPLEASVDMNDNQALYLGLQTFDLPGSDIVTVNGSAALNEETGVLNVYYRVNNLSQNEERVCNEQFIKQ